MAPVICKKLQGAVTGSAGWATNISNERGEVLISILTASEGEALLPMATGLMRGHQLASVEPQVLLYTDRDCCSQSGISLYTCCVALAIHLKIVEHSGAPRARRGTPFRNEESFLTMARPLARKFSSTRIFHRDGEAGSLSA